MAPLLEDPGSELTATKMADVDQISADAMHLDSGLSTAREEVEWRKREYRILKRQFSSQCIHTIPDFTKWPIDVLDLDLDSLRKCPWTTASQILL